jgi:hypothetical protein
MENTKLISQRLTGYHCAFNKEFKTVLDRGPKDEGTLQKLRQYWADEKVPNVDKLKGFDYDLSTFDPRKTSRGELRKIADALSEMGIIDGIVASRLGGMNCEFDRYGQEINIDKPLDAIEFLDGGLDFLKGYIAEGRDFAKDELIFTKMTINVMLALQERAKAMKPKGGVSVKA